MTFWKLAKISYRESWRSLVALPLLASIPVAVELIQHAIEIYIGMYDSAAMAAATANHPARLGFGFVKVIATMLPGYWVVRYLAWRDTHLASRFSPHAARLYVLVIAVHGVWTAINLLVAPNGWGQIAASMVVGEAFTALLLAWTVAAPLGNGMIGPRASLRIMRQRLLWTMAFLFGTMLPPLIVHNLLGVAGVFAPRLLLWPIMIADALFVGWLAALIAATSWFAANRAARLARVELVPSTGGGDVGQIPKYAA
jgi:hypothetical protein